MLSSLCIQNTNLIQDIVSNFIVLYKNTHVNNLSNYSKKKVKLKTPSLTKKELVNKNYNII